MVLSLICWLSLFLGFGPGVVGGTRMEAGLGATDHGRGTPYILDKGDNLCGLCEPRQLTVPAKVEFSKLLHATQEYKDMIKSKIDPESAAGIAILAKAQTRVVQACEVVRISGGYCSVWKAISRRDGGVIPDVTTEVLKGI